MATLEGKVALITGAAQGLGAAIAQRLNRDGADVVLADLSPDVEEVARSIGPTATSTPLDVREPSQWAAACAAVEARHGRLDILVNNAGKISVAPLGKIEPDEFRAVFEVNVLGVLHGIQSAMKLMSRTGGSIVNVSSADGLVGALGLTAYSSSKFAVRGISRTAALELASRGIRVNSVHPGGIATPMASLPAFQDLEATFYRRLPIPRIGEPAEIAAVVAFLASDDASYCTGAEFVVDGGMLAGVLT